MNTLTIVLLVILAVLIVVLIVLYFLGKKAEKKHLFLNTLKTFAVTRRKLYIGENIANNKNVCISCSVWLYGSDFVPWRNTLGCFKRYIKRRPL